MKKVSSALCLFLGLLLAPNAVLADQYKTAQKTKWPECFCTDRYGQRHEIGDIICLTVDNRSYEAKCVMVQNNPFWRDQKRGCLSSKRSPEMSPRPTIMLALYQE